MSLSWLRAALAVIVSAAPLAGCSAIFNPERSDTVIRCDNVDDCQNNETIAAALKDKRIEPICGSADGGSDDFGSNENTVCSTTDKLISCDPSKLSPTSDFVTRYNEARNTNGVYIACQDDKLGKQGCKPNTGTCDAGLTVNAYGICDDPNNPLPAYEASSENAGQDVLDQYCRQFYCDEGDGFSCTESGSDFICKRCKPGKPVGEGGCATMWVNGAPSSVYVSNDGCDPTESSLENSQFGPIPAAP